LYPSSTTTAIGPAPLDGDANNLAGGDHGFAFHRLSGDADGNGTVDQTDYMAFMAAYGNGSDYIQFRARFNIVI
jgi:hypothetical protein